MVNVCLIFLVNFDLTRHSFHVYATVAPDSLPFRHRTRRNGIWFVIAHCLRNAPKERKVRQRRASGKDSCQALY